MDKWFREFIHEGIKESFKLDLEPVKSFSDLPTGKLYYIPYKYPDASI